jgi:DNA-binding response OmpR family regulator
MFSQFRPLAAAALPPRALVVEDDCATRDVLRRHLSLEGFHVDELTDGRSSVECARMIPFEVIVLDLVLPGLDGITVCRAVRTTGVNTDTPILMLTSRDNESDKVLGLENGADDCVTRPFGVRELMARIGAITRRRKRGDRAPGGVVARQVVAPGVALDLDRRDVTVQGRAVALTRQEFELLHLLAARPGVVFSRRALLATLWSADDGVSERTVDVVVSRLRRKIEESPEDPRLILTAWGSGYRFAQSLPQ